jgi:hypothetical protein
VRIVAALVLTVAVTGVVAASERPGVYLGELS